MKLPRPATVIMPRLKTNLSLAVQTRATPPEITQTNREQNRDGSDIQTGGVVSLDSYSWVGTQLDP